MSLLVRCWHACSLAGCTVRRCLGFCCAACKAACLCVRPSVCGGQAASRSTQRGVLLKCGRLPLGRVRPWPPLLLLPLPLPSLAWLLESIRRPASDSLARLLAWLAGWPSLQEGQRRQGHGCVVC